MFTEYLAQANSVKDLMDRFINSNNLLQKSKMRENYFYNTSEISNNDYSYFELFVTAGTSYTIGTRARFISKEGCNIVQQTSANYVFTPDFTGVAYITLHNADRSGWRIYLNNIHSNEVPVYDDYVMNSIEKSNDVLSGKKWYACGDSFTHGDFSGYSGNYVFDSGKYSGENMVYPFFIGNRVDMNVVNMAVNGMTLAKKQI